MQLKRVFRIYHRRCQKGTHVLSLAEPAYPYRVIGQLTVTEAPPAVYPREVHCILSARSLQKQTEKKVDACLYFHGIVSLASNFDDLNTDPTRILHLYSTPYPHEKRTTASQLMIALTAKEYAVWKHLKMLSLISLHIEADDEPKLVLPEPATMADTDEIVLITPH